MACAFQNQLSTINSVFSLVDRSGGVESIAVSTLHRSIEISNLLIFPRRLILVLFMVTSQRHFSISFLKEMGDLNDFLFVRSLFLGILVLLVLVFYFLFLLFQYRLFSKGLFHPLLYVLLTWKEKNTSPSSS